MVDVNSGKGEKKKGGGDSITAATTATPQLVPVSGGAVMPIWSILNHCLDFPSQAEKDPPQSYIHTMTGPCWCVHCAQNAVLPEGRTTSAGATVPSRW